MQFKTNQPTNLRHFHKKNLNEIEFLLKIVWKLQVTVCII